MSDRGCLPQPHCVTVKGITVIYERGAVGLARQLFGRRPADDDLARLAGALDGATVIVSAKKKKSWLYLSVRDLRFARYETSVRRDVDGGLFAYIHHTFDDAAFQSLSEDQKLDV